MINNENYSKTKAFTFTDNLPQIPEDLEFILEKAYSRYEHFIDMTIGEFERTIIEEDRQKYPHLLLPEENGLPVFGGRECVEYMSIVSGVPEIYCLVLMCRKENYSSAAIRHLIKEIEERGKTKRLLSAHVR